MKESTLRFGEPAKGTIVYEDPQQEALRVEVQDPTARLGGYIRWSCAPGVSAETHPIIAFCVKLGRPNLQFSIAWWRMDRYAEQEALFNAPNASFWSTFPRSRIAYEPNTDWQLVIEDGTEFENPNFKGNWTDLGLILMKKDSKIQAGDCVWLKWIGVFPNTESAKAYFASPVMFNEPTPLFWHAASATICERPIFPVLPKLSAAKAALRITNEDVPPSGNIPSEKVLVAPYNEDLSFCHHAGLAMFHGELFVSWSSHEKDEDAAGQHVRVASSKDFYHWTPSKVVGKTRQAEFGETGLLCSHMFATENALHLYCIEKQFSAKSFTPDGKFTYKNYDENYGGGTVIALRMLRYTTTNGVNWSDPVEVSIDNWTNEAPRRSLTGRLFAGAGPNLAWTDDPNGFDMVLRGPGKDEVQKALKNGAWMLTEASWFQTDDYIVRMFLRSNSGYLWMSESYDNGETWTPYYSTHFVADNTMPNLGRLPDGRYYFIGNPCWNNTRFPLALCISEDGYNFNKTYIVRDEPYTIIRPGQAKAFHYGYPEVHIYGDYMYMAYSKGKEVMEITRVKLSDI